VPQDEGRAGLPLLSQLVQLLQQALVHTGACRGFQREPHLLLPLCRRRRGEFNSFGRHGGRRTVVGVVVAEVAPRRVVRSHISGCCPATRHRRCTGTARRD
jgi:hypothetical protein